MISGASISKVSSKLVTVVTAAEKSDAGLYKSSIMRHTSASLSGGFSITQCLTTNWKQITEGNENE
jgi:hypothetical protein